MDSQALKTFVAIAECGSFSIAAEQLHLTQPAVSKRVSALEEQLDTPLFDRVGRRVLLTEAGRKLLPRAQGILNQLKIATQEIHDLQGDISGLLQMATSHHIGMHRLPTILRQYAEQHAQVVLDIDFIDSEKAYDKVLKGEVELAVITLSPVPQPPIEQRLLWQDKLVFVAHKQHPIFDGRTISLKELSQHRAILPGLNTYTGQIVSSLFADNKLQLNSSMATNYLETIKMLVDIGLGWSVIPATMLDDDVGVIDIHQVNINRSLGYIFHQDRSLSNAGQAFIAQLKR
ncbi:HTH-type transcriptional activator CmpR [Sinobacterium norvegicum]|uniref:HTH-type transcriptional activator CmpR n=1 Tax=Sinobacterium norvegicum TaxID=1641715 RepID=A0ABN8EG89_9GAMM|nr:LysR family transcriptional regulator [Sinobacterium norvegicum]CAH0990372.1 HTH-type transcriptional activator CmpR [Sinobacterium norvegicum]